MYARAGLLALQAVLPSAQWLAPEGLGWQKMDSLPPWKPHTGSIAAPLSDGSMLLIGGQAGRHGGGHFDCFNCTSDVWQFKHQKAEWTDLSKDVPWDPRWGHSVVTQADDTVWLFFGCCEKGKPTVMLRDVWSFNPMKGTPWKKMDTGPPFEGVQATSAAIAGSEVWFVGGWSQHRGTLSHVVVFNLETLSWTVKSPHGAVPWDSRADHATAISPDGKWLVMFGGQHAKEGGKRWNRCEDTWRVPIPSAKPSEWVRIGNLAAARSSPGVFVLHTGWLVTLGGHWTPPSEQLLSAENREAVAKHHEETEFHTYSDVLALNLNAGSKSWKTVEKQAAWTPRDDVAVGVTTDDTILIFGGGTLYGGGGYLHDVWRLEKASEKLGLPVAHDEL